jgi:hypothetical protein
VEQIERRDRLTRYEFDSRYRRPNRPVVFAGLCGAWVSTWTPETLRDRLGDREVLAEGPEYLPYHRSRKRTTMSNVVDSVASGKLTLRLKDDNLLDTFPELDFLDKRAVLTQYFDDTVVCKTLWLQARGNISSFHHDGAVDNMNALLHGRKRFVLAPIWEINNLYAHTFETSPVTPIKLDLERFPRAARVHFYETILEPGDVLFLPAYWWHMVESLKLCINLTYRYRPRISRWRLLSGVPLGPKAALLAIPYILTKRTEGKILRFYERFKPPLVPTLSNERDTTPKQHA